MGSKILAFEPEDYVIRVVRTRLLREDLEYCYNAFQPTTINGMVIGTTLFKKYFVKFEFGASPAISTAVKP